MGYVEFNKTRARADTVGFTFIRPERAVSDPVKKPVKKKRNPPTTKRIPYKVLHADKRHGSNWPRLPRSGPGNVWTGWLTHREYNLIEFYYRYEVNNIYECGEMLGIKHNSAQRMYYGLEEAGLIEGEVENFSVTPMGKILFHMTDQYILQLDLGEE